MLLTTLALIRFWSPLIEFTTGLAPVFEASRWWAWLWVGPANALGFLLGWIGVLVAVAGAFALAFLLAAVAASPFLDALSRRVERVLTGRVEEAGDGSARDFFRDALRVVLDEARRTFFFLGVQAAIVLAGVLLPGGALLAPPLLTLFVMLFLPLDFAAYTLDRRRVPFAARRSWVRMHAPMMVGFGATGFVISLLPGINFLAMPIFVVAGTMLALRVPPVGGDEPAPPVRSER